MMPKTIDQVIEKWHEPGNTLIEGLASGLIAMRTERDGALWHYYTVHPVTGEVMLTGTTINLED